MLSHRPDPERARLSSRPWPECRKASGVGPRRLIFVWRRRSLVARYCGAVARPDARCGGGGDATAERAGYCCCCMLLPLQPGLRTLIRARPLSRPDRLGQTDLLNQCLTERRPESMVSYHPAETASGSARVSERLSGRRLADETATRTASNLSPAEAGTYYIVRV